MQLVRDDYQIQIVTVVICFIIFKACMIVLLIIRVKIAVLIKWTYRLPQSCRSLNLEWLAYVSMQSNLFKHISFWSPFLG